MTALQAFPHVLANIKQRWGHPDELESYVSSILICDRPFRQGFPIAVFSELSNLLHAHQILYGTPTRPSEVACLGV